MSSNQDFDYVGFWARAWAWLIDWILFVLLTVPLLYAIYGRVYFQGKLTDRGPIDFLNTFVLASVALFFFWLIKAATPGKMALSAKIVDAATGQTPTVRQLVIRYLGYFIAALPLGLGLLWIAVDPKKQGWHDKMAGTAVVRAKKDAL